MWKKACFQSCFVQSELCNIDEIEEILTSFELHVLHQIVSLDKSKLTQVKALVLSLCMYVVHMQYYAVFCDSLDLELDRMRLDCGSCSL